jgi:hypothetical protein
MFFGEGISLIIDKRFMRLDFLKGPTFFFLITEKFSSLAKRLAGD